MKSLFKISVVALISMFSANYTGAQDVLDGAYVKEHTITRRVIPYTYLREADVMWSKRVWRVIDLREKLNYPLYYPTEKINDRKSLFHVIEYALREEGSISAYDPGPLLDQDEFLDRLTKVEIEEVFARLDTVYINNIETDEIEAKVVPIELSGDQIKMFKLKEDWFFDRQRSVMECRIIGLAPMKVVKSDEGEIRGYAEVFWLYFPECRYVFANHEVFNPDSDSERRSLDDVFHKRMFASYVSKESNVYDRPITAYKQGLDALLESEKIKDHLFKMEHDLWSF